MNNKWSEFRLRVNIDASPEKVYRAWATPGGLESWFLRKAIIRETGGEGTGGDMRSADALIQKGDGYEWYWHGHPDSVAVKGAIGEANGKDRFLFTFSLGCPVSISLYRECDETIVELTEGELPVDEETALQYYVGDSKGWLFYLTNLKSVLEGGLDLRNRKIELTNVITA